MSPIQCAQFERILEEQPDGPLPAPAAAHLNGCADCRLLWSDLEAIRTAGMEWGSEEVAPPEHLWISLRVEMESEGLIQRKPARGRLVGNLVRRRTAMGAGGRFDLLAADCRHAGDLPDQRAGRKRFPRGLPAARSFERAGRDGEAGGGGLGENAGRGPRSECSRRCRSGILCWQVRCARIWASLTISSLCVKNPFANGPMTRCPVITCTGLTSRRLSC